MERSRKHSITDPEMDLPETGIQQDVSIQCPAPLVGILETKSLATVVTAQVHSCEGQAAAFGDVGGVPWRRPHCVNSVGAELRCVARMASICIS